MVPDRVATRNVLWTKSSLHVTAVSPKQFPVNDDPCYLTILASGCPTKWQVKELTGATFEAFGTLARPGPALPQRFQDLGQISRLPEVEAPVQRTSSAYDGYHASGRC